MSGCRKRFQFGDELLSSSLFDIPFWNKKPENIPCTIILEYETIDQQRMVAQTTVPAMNCPGSWQPCLLLDDVRVRQLLPNSNTQHEGLGSKQLLMCGFLWFTRT